MTLLVSLALALGTFAFLVYPLFRRHRQGASEGSDPRLADLYARRDSAYSAIKELEFDHALGNLSDQDFNELEERYKARAISLLKNIDEVGQGEGLDSRIERRIRELRRPDKEPPIAARYFACPSCGSPVAEVDRFCAACGARLPTEGN